MVTFGKGTQLVVKPGKGSEISKEHQAFLYMFCVFLTSGHTSDQMCSTPSLQFPTLRICCLSLAPWICLMWNYGRMKKAMKVISYAHGSFFSHFPRRVFPPGFIGQANQYKRLIESTWQHPNVLSCDWNSCKDGESHFEKRPPPVTLDSTTRGLQSSIIIIIILYLYNNSRWPPEKCLQDFHKFHSSTLSRKQPIIRGLESCILAADVSGWWSDVFFSFHPISSRQIGRPKLALSTW